MKHLFTSVSLLAEIDGVTWSMLTLMVGSTMWIVKEKVSSIFTLLIMAPLAMGFSAVSYAAFQSLGFFNVKSMAEWLMWTVSSGTVGCGLVLTGTAMMSSLSDRKEARLVRQ